MLYKGTTIIYIPREN